VTSAGRVSPSTGWGVTHLYYRVRPDRAAAGAGAQLVSALAELAAAPDHQALCSVVLGLKADLGVMALGPDLEQHERLARTLRTAALGTALEPVYSFVSLTEVSEYASAAAERYRQDKLHPKLPRRALLAFYPMSKARDPAANWYLLDFDERRALMRNHAEVGRKFAGRVLQLITGATGLDDHEWGVTLLSDDATTIKEIVYQMRFDEVTARYGRFGPFFVGLTCEPAELPGRLGLPD